MMAHKQHLQDLLQEDQEPFILKNYIADRRCQIKRRPPSSPKTQLQLKKQRNPISQNSNFPGKFCKNACLFSFQDSPDVRKSPLFEFPSPAANKSPCRNSAIFLHIPTRTAAVLLEAALKIQKHSKQRTQTKNQGGLGLFGSILKKLTNRNRTQKRKIGGDGVKNVAVKDILRWDSSVGRKSMSGNGEKVQENLLGLEEIISATEISACSEMGLSCSCNGRLSSAVWSESNEEEKSLNTETTCSSSSNNSEDESEEIELSDEQRKSDAFAYCENSFSKSPFRFVLHTSPTSSGHRTPDFASPASSPCRHSPEERLQKFQVQDGAEEEDKEQCSPVSVLDPPFEEDDDDEGEVHDDDDEDEDGGFDIECSYAIVQRAKQQLLQKLRRFEKLAELDPIELEKRMLEDALEEEEGSEVDDEAESLDRAKTNSNKKVDEFLTEVISKSSFNNLRRVPSDMKRLISDLIIEEEGFEDREEAVKRVCKRLESWKEVESNTIDMMVEVDFKREMNGWNCKNDQEQVKETAMEIEMAIFGMLVEELV